MMGELINANLGQLTAGVILRYARSRAVELGMPSEVVKTISEASFSLTHGAYTKMGALGMVERAERAVQILGGYDADLAYYFYQSTLRITKS